MRECQALSIAAVNLIAVDDESDAPKEGPRTGPPGQPAPPFTD